jgi:hypothetical protein
MLGLAVRSQVRNFAWLEGLPVSPKAWWLVGDGRWRVCAGFSISALRNNGIKSKLESQNICWA